MTTVLKRSKALAIVIAAAMTAPLAALDLEAGAFFGNLGLPWAGETPIVLDPYPANQWIYGGRAAFVDDLGEGFSLRAEYVTDTVLRNVVRGVVTYDTGIASISAGPMVGVFNTAETLLKAGIDIGFRIEATGLAFFSATVESSMGAGLATAGDYSQERSELAAGWYVRNAICTVSMLTKRYTRMVAGGDSIVDASTDYAFSVDVFKKGAPYRVVTELGYRTMTRTYPGDLVDGLGAVLLGATVSAEVLPTLTVVAGLDSGVYVFGLEELAARGPAPTSFMFSASLGFILRLGAPQAGAEPETL